MLGKTHLVTGALCAVPVAQAFHADLSHTLLFLLAGALGGILPDIDHKNGMLRQKMGCFGGLAFGWIKHRGITHTLIALAFVAGLALRFEPVYGVAFGVGYLSHIITDMMTKAGLMTLWPVYRGSLHALPRPLLITTGSRVEQAFAALIVFALLGVTFRDTGEWIRLLQSIPSVVGGLLP